ncbi:hypothetical protein A2382_04895 [Candidatus Woesebacteria bacterium RIFOXYB1_FULL_38_16]|uniref:Uncharacterized protein n=1 Tax=Candidatus Woesebacteria bacterium RIFOXYB1_FULL_38_16 TaxID=1802538 RepID=A0A1F8CWS7_9BACT|nr:MAG: hypothetical protein A2191_00265 [Candidatus Woesebacteria bacterium RIFOXYA1_FULL_38_9]OGM79995.1 MAG: hypothetical protein A2382_04895 [Candidatus Woesebacteria bacterium RIFOXYB1_FULL_38_16]
MKKGLPTIVTFAIITTITSLSWIGFEIYRKLTVKPSPPVPQEIIEPLNSNLDLELLHSLNTKIYLNDDQIQDTLLITNEPQPTPTPTPEAEIPIESTTEAVPLSQ